MKSNVSESARSVSGGGDDEDSKSRGSRSKKDMKHNHRSSVSKESIHGGGHTNTGMNVASTSQRLVKISQQQQNKHLKDL